MSFLWPFMLLGLMLMPLAVLVYLRRTQQRRQVLARYGQFGQAPSRPAAVPGYRRHLPAALFLLALMTLLIALARPQAVVSLPRLEGTVILAFDVSGSMQADDMAPTRLDAAKAAAQKFVEAQPTDIAIGVVSFSDGGFPIQTPTQDREAILAAIARLTPQRGTSVGNGLLMALTALLPPPKEALALSDLTPVPTPSPTPMPPGVYAPAAIVLLTDGENNEDPDPLAVAQVAVDRGVRIYTIGVGSEAGVVLNIEGFSVHSRLDATLLQQLAQFTGGAYYHAANAEDLNTIYANLDPQLTLKPETMEITSLLAGLSGVLLLIGCGLSLAWFGRVP